MAGTASTLFGGYLALALLGGCSGKSQPSGASSAGKPAVAQAAAGDAAESDLSAFAFEPPENGQLTEAQVQMFVEVQKRAGALREAGKRKGEPIGAVDLAAARDLKENPKEFNWVGQRIREVQRWQMGRDLLGQLAAGDRDYLRLLKTLRSQETDPARIAELDTRISELGTRQVEGELTLTLSHNADLVAKYKDQIDGATSDEEKFTTGRLAADQAIPEALFSDFSSDLIDETPPP